MRKASGKPYFSSNDGHFLYCIFLCLEGTTFTLKNESNIFPVWIHLKVYTQLHFKITSISFVLLCLVSGCRRAISRHIVCSKCIFIILPFTNSLLQYERENSQFMAFILNDAGAGTRSTREKTQWLSPSWEKCFTFCIYFKTPPVNFLLGFSTFSFYTHVPSRLVGRGESGWKATMTTCIHSIYCKCSIATFTTT